MLTRLALSFLSAIAVSAEEPRPVVIGQEWTLHSGLLEENRTIQVHLPRDYWWSEARYPVVYLLDGETNFHHTTATLDTLSRLGHIPDLIVVAINNTDRTRDLTSGRLHPPAENEEDRFPTSGGADRFLDFFEQELMPHVEAPYRTDPYRILIGHSFGELYPLWRPPSSDSDAGIGGLEHHYTRLSNVRRHPNSPNVYDSLGEALATLPRSVESEVAPMTSPASRRKFLGLVAAAPSLLTSRPFGSEEQASDEDWNRDELAHLIPTASHDQLLIKASFHRPVDAAPRLRVAGSFVPVQSRETIPISVATLAFPPFARHIGCV